MNLLNWLREEWRLARLETWADAYDSPIPCTMEDPRCIALAERQLKVRLAMARTKAGILDGKA